MDMALHQSTLFTSSSHLYLVYHMLCDTDTDACMADLLPWIIDAGRSVPKMLSPVSLMMWRCTSKRWVAGRSGLRARGSGLGARGSGLRAQGSWLEAGGYAHGCMVRSPDVNAPCGGACHTSTTSHRSSPCFAG